MFWKIGIDIPYDYANNQLQTCYTNLNVGECVLFFTTSNLISYTPSSRHLAAAPGPGTPQTLLVSCPFEDPAGHWIM